ncbi:amidohydrolase family protein [Natronincola ferrireducens]|uniref:Imidazolonepropionase n=1 Tax=Natronincola ferrireducens TaxID=393762 RepID=A0A1G9E4Z2_9FIRM|nr:amidohydrolase family protein [Natronincola ferrireducens]SDK71168.1 Imidazolonepropionase [Natronincola ferrireducens]
MLLLKNGKIFTMEDEIICYGDILIDNGRIVHIGHNIQASDIETIDLHHQIVLPGLIDGSTHLGLIESGKKFEGDDVSEKHIPITPHLNTRDGIYPWDECFDNALRNGVTTVVVNSGHDNVIGSQSCAVKTKRDILEKRIINPFVYIQANLGDSTKKWNQNKQETPLSRMGIVHLLRKTLLDTQIYIKKKKAGKIDFTNYSLKYEALEKVIEGKCPLKITAHKAQDILIAIRIKQEFNINILVDYGTEGYMVLNELERANIPVFLGSCLTDQSSLELQNRRADSGHLLSSRGLCTCITTHHPDVSVELLTLSAAIAVKEGMVYKEALKSITINPAKALGLDNRIGSIKVGKDADIVVFDGDPLKSMSKVTMTLINGEIVYKS